MDYKKEILFDINWRLSELVALKSIPFRYNFLPNHKEILLKYSIPSIYALWEGFVKNCFRIYIREINNLNLSINETHINVLTHCISIEDKLSLENPRMNFVKKKEFVEYYQNLIFNPLKIGQDIPTKSNVDFKVINEILVRFNLIELPNSYETKLKKLVWYRNSIAHGDNSLPVAIEDINEFSNLVNDLMVEIFSKIEEGFTNESFKKKD